MCEPFQLLSPPVNSFSNYAIKKSFDIMGHVVCHKNDPGLKRTQKYTQTHTQTQKHTYICTYT